MKKILFILLLIVSMTSKQGYSQTGRNCFNTQFHKDATSLDMTNAYLLGYLCTMDYAQYLRYLIKPVPEEKDSRVQPLFRHDDLFLETYKPLLTPFFTPASSTNTTVLIKPTSTINTNVTLDKNITGLANLTEPEVTFRFIHKCLSNGYDPEAILISTPTTVYVVFRGTDRVDCANPSFLDFDYQWNEWLKTDFDFGKEPASFMNAGIQGNVHKGMMFSLMTQNFASDLASTVDSFSKNKSTGTIKKIWITGHSLGGAQAQLFAMYLKYSKNITAQGLYLYESPHPGDQTFVNQLNNTLGKTHIQRFEFGDDPICTLPPIAFFFARAGERNYFTDYNSSVLRTEQNLLDDGKIFCAMSNLTPEQIPVAPVVFVFPPGCPGSTCFHHPTFVLAAIRHALSTTNPTVLSSLPDGVPLPAIGDNCTTGDLIKAQNNILNNIAIATGDAITSFAWSADNLVNNVLGTISDPEGNYKIASYSFKNNTKKYLNWNGTAGGQLTISTVGTVFTLQHKLTGGYQLFSGSANLAADVTFNALGLPTGTEKTTPSHVIMKTKDNTIGDEETWYFFAIANAPHTYVLYNWNTHHVLDAADNCLKGGDCGIYEFNGNSNDATQVWILEKQ